MAYDFSGTYDVNTAAGIAFDLLNKTTKVQIWTEDKTYKMQLIDSNSVDLNGVSQSAVVDPDTGNLMCSLADKEGTKLARCVMAGWTDQDSGQTFLFGQIYVGDPEGAGGFGAQGEGG